MDFEKLNKTNCLISNIQNNDKVLIGGSCQSKLDLGVTADIDNFEDFFFKSRKKCNKL